MTKNKVNKKKPEFALIPKTKQKIAFALAAAFNVFMIPEYDLPDPGIFGNLLGVICAFGVLISEPAFKLTTPQKYYIEKSKLSLMIFEFVLSVVFGVLSYIALLYILF